MGKIIEGILPLWKEKGMTSFDCVFKARKILGIKKIGHAGTLDPEVDGVLPMGVGRGTKILEYMLESDKMYTGELLLGYSTSTEDATGEVIERKRVENDISNQKIDKILRDFEGEIEQTPPMFSAVKVDGKRLYEYAFEGIEIDRPSRMIEIYQIRRTSDIIFNDKDKTARFSFEVSSSKGTYIRTLAVDIGKKLGYPAHMSRLTRTESGSIKEKDTVSLEELEKAVEEGNVSNLLLPIEYGLEIFPRYPINDEIWQQVKNGRVFSLDKFKIDNYPVLFTYNEKAVAIYNHHPSKEGIIKPIKVLRTEW